MTVRVHPPVFARTPKAAVAISSFVPVFARAPKADAGPAIL
jgi:hypothetical protein